MRGSRRTFASRVLIAIAISPAAVIAAPASKDFCDVRYEQVDIGEFSPFENSFATDLNNRGHVTGNISGRTFLWSCDKGVEDIAQEIEQPDNLGIMLNERDQIVIMAAAQYPKYFPDTLLWERGKPPVLISGELPFDALSLTNAGVVTTYDSVWSRAAGIKPIDIGVPVVFSLLSNYGRLGGAYADESTGDFYLFTWTDKEGVRTLGLAPPDSPYPADMNDRGDLLVGDENTAFVIDRNGGKEVLPLRPDAVYLNAYRLNLAREVIGAEVAVEFQPHGSRSRSFVWDRRNGYRGLDDLFEVTPGNAFEPTAINDWGWIVGNRRDFNATLLVPVPAHIRRFEKLRTLKGPPLCRLLDQAKVHRLMCSAAR